LRRQHRDLLERRQGTLPHCAKNGVVFRLQSGVKILDRRPTVAAAALAGTVHLAGAIHFSRSTIWRDRHLGGTMS
jgi:hypothetical protein